MSRDELHTRAQPELGYSRCGCARKVLCIFGTW